MAGVGLGSPLRRILFSLFMGVVACGMTFYVILFASLLVMSVTHGVDRASTPGLQTGLTHVVTPVSIVAGVCVFVVALVNLNNRDRFSKRQHSESSSKAAV